jgi:DNA-binding NtrC family response regulator
MATLLIIDDDAAVLTALETLFRLAEYQVRTARTAEHALAQLAGTDTAIDLVLQDMNFAKGEMSGAQGRQLFYQIKALYPQLPVVLLTAWTSLDMVVELVKAGATDYIAKPWDDQRLLTTVANALKLSSLTAAQQRLAQERQAAFAGKDLCGLVYASTAMERLLAMALQLAPAQAAILITGENGSGKEGIAQLLHANSNRRSKPFVKVNMGALPADLIEAELFGAEAGAYSGAMKTRLGRFEAADGGTLFLDEIGNLSLSGQMKLLRVLQTGEFERLGSSQTRKVDVRLVSATNADLPQAINRGEFRQDLFYRINVVQLHVPPLRERVDDIVPLAQHFLDAQNQSGQHSKNLSEAAIGVLQQYHWPGNVRELQNCCQRAWLLSAGAQITPADLALPGSALSGLATPAGLPPAPLLQQTDAGKRSLDDVDKASIEAALQQAQGVIARAAKVLGISRQALYRRMEFYGIATP